MADQTVARILTEGAMEVHGRIAGSSNATLLVTCRLDDDELLAVYKPHQGERPLWDFPGGLYRREVAAYVLSELLGWGLVPETVERDEGPFGCGSVQRYVPEDGTSHYFTLRDDPRWHPTLIRLCAFDVAANNADRKSGHVLLAEDRLWAIDNGLCFNEDDKLRTVIWDFGGPCSHRARWTPSGSGWPGCCATRLSPNWSTTVGGRPTRGPWSEPYRLVLRGPPA
jgi:uncharacterized repeat protein (TIGR03843 family)